MNTHITYIAYEMGIVDIHITSRGVETLYMAIAING
jgi:hypothetical protein